MVQDRIDQEASQTLTTFDEYYNSILNNNKKIFKIINNNFHFFDVEDQKITQDYFIKDYVCYEIEKNTPLPNRIALKLKHQDGSMYSAYMRPQRISVIRNKSEFVEMVQNKYRQKQKIISNKNSKIWKKIKEKSNTPTSTA